MARRWTIWAVLVVVLAAPAGAWAVPSLTFIGSVLLAGGGSLSYGGTDFVDPLVGVDIVIQSVTGGGTPSNSGDTLYCFPACDLDFTTGANLTEPGSFPGAYAWAGGGTFTLGGSLYNDPGGAGGLVVSSSTLVSGTWLSPVSGFAAGSTFSMSGGGFDTKDPTLLAHYGIGNTAFVFGNTEIAGLFTPNLITKAFTADVDTASIINTAAEPGQLLLLGVGLAGVGILARRRFTGRDQEGR
jgi:hypothetical protein